MRSKNTGSFQEGNVTDFTAIQWMSYVTFLGLKLFVLLASAFIISDAM
jgi:hypothetical protein